MTGSPADDAATGQSKGVPASPLLTDADAERLQACLAGDGVAVIPTDTVYGLACNPDSDIALRRIYELKGRPPQKPAAVMFFSLDAALATLTELGPRTRAAAKVLLPGPVTLLLPNPWHRFPLACEPQQVLNGGEENAAHAGAASPLGLRIPLLDGPLAALASIRTPALQSSANFSGDPDPRTLAEVPAPLREGVDLVLDGGELAGRASTVIDLSRYEDTGEWRVVREGPLDAQTIKQRLMLASQSQPRLAR